MAEAQHLEMQQMVVDEQQVIARSWTGAICKGTWGGNPVPVRIILITDCRQNVLTHYEKYASPTFVHEHVLRVYGHVICPQQIHGYILFFIIFH
jgi:hypothetical protein